MKNGCTEQTGHRHGSNGDKGLPPFLCLRLFFCLSVFDRFMGSKFKWCRIMGTRAQIETVRNLHVIPFTEFNINGINTRRYRQVHPKQGYVWPIAGFTTEDQSSRHAG